jgi:hypothetical protein
MSEVVHSITSADGRFRIAVVRRPTGGYQLAYLQHVQERVPEYDFFWEGWVSVPERITLTDTPERGAALAAEAMALIERQEAQQSAATDGRRDEGSSDTTASPA